jgi:DNA-binding NarL/FixJ family response regulator
VAKGLRDHEIAERRCTSLATIRTHVTRILDKLGVRSRVEAALVARGLIPQSDGVT